MLNGYTIKKLWEFLFFFSKHFLLKLPPKNVEIKQTDKLLKILFLYNFKHEWILSHISHRDALTHFILPVYLYINNAIVQQEYKQAPHLFCLTHVLSFTSLFLLSLSVLYSFIIIFFCCIFSVVLLFIFCKAKRKWE